MEGVRGKLRFLTHLGGMESDMIAVRQNFSFDVQMLCVCVRCASCHPVTVLRASFCTICSLLRLASDMIEDQIELVYSMTGRVHAL